MRDEIKESWKVRRRNAIARLVEAWEKDGATENRADPDPIFSAADAVTVAHLAAQLEWEGGPLTEWHDKTARTIEQLVEIWEEYERNDEDREAVEELLNVALDAFAISHVAASFEWANGPLQWGSLHRQKLSIAD